MPRGGRGGANGLTGCSSTRVRGTSGCRRSKVTRAAFEECRHSSSCSSSSVVRHAESGQAPATADRTEETCRSCCCSSLCINSSEDFARAPGHNTQKRWLGPAAHVVAHHLLSQGRQRLDKLKAAALGECCKALLKPAMIRCISISSCLA